MKLQFTLLAGAAAVALCGSAFAGSAEDVIAKEKCNKCHTATTTKKAPSWASLAAKYKGNPDAANKLFNELKAGGKVGGEDDHLAIKASDADIKAIVQIVLSSK
ncbi:MAG: c-type cytochrome [Burkholderiaceae bacterium]